MRTFRYRIERIFAYISLCHSSWRPGMGIRAKVYLDTCSTTNQLQYWNDAYFIEAYFTFNYFRAPNPESCMDNCITEEACQSFAFNRQEDKCFLSDMVGDLRTERPGWVTGARCGAHKITSPLPNGTYPVQGLSAIQFSLKSIKLPSIVSPFFSGFPMAQKQFRIRRSYWSLLWTSSRDTTRQIYWKI